MDDSRELTISCRPAGHFAWRRGAILLLVISAMLPGCAAFHPIRGVPAPYVPHEYRGTQRAGYSTINPSLLVRRSQGHYRIDSGDVLAVYIPGVLGRMSTNLDEAGEEPPIVTPFTPADPPTIGYPVMVRDDGTISLPYVRPVHVAGRTLPEVDDAIRRAYTVDATILAGEADVTKRIVISLQRRREYRVLVVRRESGDASALQQNQVSNVNIGSSKKGDAQLVRLAADENDVLHALAKAEGSSGLPGLDEENAIYVLRRPGQPQVSGGYSVPGAYGVPARPPMGAPVSPMGGHSTMGGRVMQTSAMSMPTMSPHDPYGGTYGGHSALGAMSQGGSMDAYANAYGPAYGDWASADIGTIKDNPNVIRIPVRLAPGEAAHVSEADVTLYDGDIVFIEAGPTEVFYTGGLLGGGQFTLPRDYDITLTQAISIAQGTNTAGGPPRAIGGVSALNSDVTISPSHVVVLRTLPDGRRFPIEADLYRALRRQEEDILIQPGDMIMLQYTKTEAVAAFVERHLLEGALFGVTASQLQTNNQQ